MTRAKEFYCDSPALASEDEDEKTLTAIGEGVRDAEAGRTTSIEEARKLLHKWVSPKF